MPFREWLLKPVLDTLSTLKEDIMADVSAVLNQVATDLRETLSPAIAALVAENATLRTRNAELEGEDVAESDAAANVKSAFDDVASNFATPELPDVPELPAEPEVDPNA